jgi:hypothetical protein
MEREAQVSAGGGRDHAIVIAKEVQVNLLASDQEELYFREIGGKTTSFSKQI